RRLHAGAAAAIEQRDATAPDFPLRYGMLAHHWEMAGAEERALGYLGKAGEHELRTGAHTDAHRLLSRALTLDERTGGAAGVPRRAQWLRLLGEAAFGLGDGEASVRHAAHAMTQLGHRVPRGTAGWSATL